MRVSYRGYNHPENEVTVAAFMVRPKFSARNKRKTTVYQAHLHGEIQPNNPNASKAAQQASMNTRIGEIVDTYAWDNGDYYFRHDDGTPTRHSLISANSISGVKVKHRSWPNGDRQEYATMRTFYIVLEAEYIEADENLLSFQESFTFVGTGGPRWHWYDVQFGPPVYQQECQYTHQRIIQTGSAVGLITWPQLGVDFGPFFDYEHYDRRQIAPAHPEAYTNGWLNFPIEWTFHFSLPQGTSAYPSLR